METLAHHFVNFLFQKPNFKLMLETKLILGLIIIFCIYIIFKIFKKPKRKEDYFARVCSTTGEGMDEGWVWNGGFAYDKYQENVIKKLRELVNNGETFCDFSKEELDKMSDEELLSAAYDDEESGSDYLYWTSWYDNEEEDTLYDEEGNIVYEDGKLL